MSIGFRPLERRFGAEVVGAPPDLAMDEAMIDEIEAAWYRHSILTLRGPELRPEQQIGFTRRFGAPHIMSPPEFNLESHPERSIPQRLSTKPGTAG